MSITFDSKSTNIGNLIGPFSKTRLIVPEFQRGYSWGKKHLEAFWDDIFRFEQDDNRKAYFLGPIVTLEGEEDGILYLLDGQQRVATIIIFLSVVRDLAKDAGTEKGKTFADDVQKSLIFKEDGELTLTMGETDKAYFRDNIQNDPPLARKAKLRTHRNISTARSFFYDKMVAHLAGANPQARLELLRLKRRTLTMDLVMANIPVTSERDAFQIFETLNDRGLRLSAPDLLLNYLMREAKPESDRKRIREFWTEMVEMMGRRDINRFLQHMWISKYGDLKKTDLFTALKTHIEDESVNSLEFTTECAGECERYIQLVGFDEAALKTATANVRTLLQQLNVQSALPLLLSVFQQVSSSDFATVCQYILVFVVRYSIIAGLESSGMEDVFYALARDVRLEVQATSGKVESRRVTTLIKRRLSDNAASDDIVKASVPELILDRNEALYIVSRIARYKQSTTKEVALGEANLEHIYPKRPATNEWGGEQMQETLNALLWHIGNLTWLGKRLNEGVANGEYASVKMPSYENTSELEITREIATTYTEWNDKTIRHRAEGLVPAILQIWNFDNPSRV
ncbi:MAG: DUF262 domain-containing protein [Pyrinomonadaceae bacterium]